MVEAATVGDALPSEAELCDRFGVSRMTARHAIEQLAQEGLVMRRRGQGTFVASRPMHRRPGVFLSFSEEMARRGMVASSRLLGAVLGRSRPEEADALGLAPKSDVVRVSRVRVADGRPIAIEEAVLPGRLAAVLSHDLEHGSLHAALLEEYGLVARRAWGTITARLARASEVTLLDLPPHAALLVELRVIADGEGQPFERTETRYVADRYVIDVEHLHPDPTG